MSAAMHGPFDKAYLERRILGEFALAPHLGIEVEAADDGKLVLRAPLAQNANYKGTAFGGSLFSVAVLTGWAWVSRYLASPDVEADAVIQESTMRYLQPVHGAFRASLVTPATPQIDKFRKMLLRAGRGRICLRVDIHQEDALATVFEGVFAAVLRQP